MDDSVMFIVIGIGAACYIGVALMEVGYKLWLWYKARRDK